MSEVMGRVLRVDACGVCTEREQIIPAPGHMPRPCAWAEFGCPPWAQVQCWTGHWTHPSPAQPAPFAFALDDQGIWLACYADGRAALQWMRPASCHQPPDPLAALNRLMLAIGAQRTAQLGRLSFPARPDILQFLPESPHNWCGASLPSGATPRHT